MTAAADASTAPSPPTPEECSHAAPVVGIMAHEFAPYSGAIGPEGKRRTVMYYGPVLGGLPIEAWHCEVCGLLRLTFPDGRREERRLWPGPQPGLIAAPMAGVVAPESVTGRQARVSGVSAPPQLFAVLAPSAPSPEFELRLPQLPAWGLATWSAVLLLSASAVGLLLAGILAVYDWTTPGAELPLFYTVLGLFGGALTVLVGDSAMRHFFPTLAQSPAVSLRGRPDIDPATAVSVALLVLCTGALFAGGILAVYDWTTPDAEKPLFFGGLACFVGAIVIKLADVARRHFTRH